LGTASLPCPVCGSAAGFELADTLLARDPFQLIVVVVVMGMKGLRVLLMSAWLPYSVVRVIDDDANLIEEVLRAERKAVGD
jgi:hypothetical protein